MPDDLFSRLFELFNQPGPVNWKLAGEVARHLAGETQPVDPWAAEQVEELSLLAQSQIEAQAPFPVPVTAVAVVDRRQWVDESLERLAYVAEAFSESGPGMIPGMGAAVAGMQVGTLAGTIAATTMGAFESGFPLDGEARLLIIGPGLEAAEALLATDPREVRLSVAASEIAHAALFRVPWLTETLGHLIETYAAYLVPDPEKLMEIWGEDPGSLPEKLADPATLEELTGGKEGTAHRQNLESFLAVTSGYRRVLVDRAFPKMLPSLDRLHSHRPDEIPMLGLPMATQELTDRGAGFCREVERRYGVEALDNIWLGPDRLPTNDELEDPLGWAARVLLEELS
ncbi:MAG TPA: zinc-dependent metalloprotease [Acidimicrobiia bacterium]|nr:zinc-dependent metalloprotease [Acidimicrobiia bacterium]